MEAGIFGFNKCMYWGFYVAPMELTLFAVFLFYYYIAPLGLSLEELVAVYLIFHFLKPCIFIP